VSPSPADTLVPPSDRAGLPDVVNDLLAIPDLVSPSFWLNEMIKVTLGVDPLAETARHLGGDWRGIAVAGDALDHLARFDAAVAGALDRENDRVAESWDGNAAEAAARYFDDLAAAVRTHGPALQALAAELGTTADGIWSIAEVVKGLLVELTDSLIAGAVCLAAGTALLETGVGAVAGYAAAAWYAWRATSAWAEVLTQLSHAVLAAKALVGASAVLVGRLDELASMPLPAAAYDHPGAGR
jgi:uncharacterized protein YukE